jgi:hypothetical protein
VKTIYLHGEMDCDVYIQTQWPSRTFWNKGLPGTKHARRLWNNQFTLWVKELGFQQLTSKSCVLLQKGPGWKLGTTNVCLCSQTIQEMQNYWDIVDNGYANHF